MPVSLKQINHFINVNFNLTEFKPAGWKDILIIRNEKKDDTLYLKISSFSCYSFLLLFIFLNIINKFSCLNINFFLLYTYFKNIQLINLFYKLSEKIWLFLPYILRNNNHILFIITLRYSKKINHTF